MSSVNSVSGNSPLQKIVQQPISKEIPADAPKQIPLTDKVELSGMSHMLSALKAGKDFRADKVADIKAQIASGSYEDDHKLHVAADRLLDELLK
jgi:negative regulator of flagellin synthesis FlgM